MAEALGVASGVIAVIDMSAKVLNICGNYLSQAKAAKDDIRKLATQVTLVSATAYRVQELVNGPGGRALTTSAELKSALEQTFLILEELEESLGPSTMHRFGKTALEWPFKSKWVEKTIANLARYQDIISLALTVDQTYALSCFVVCAIFEYIADARL